MKRKTTENFIDEGNLKHNFGYDYSLSTYVNSKTPLTIICKTCNNHFNQTPDKHLRGQGCPICKNNKKRKSKNIICELCGDNYKVRKNKKINKYICKKCYEDLFQPKEICSVCKELHQVYKRENSVPFCIKCHNPLLSECCICHEMRKAEKITENGPVCSKCYEKHYRPKRKCFKCKEINIVKKIYLGNPYCPKCYVELFVKKEICNKCKKEKKVSKRNSDGTALCQMCCKEKEICSICKKLKNVNMRIENNLPICKGCYDKLKKENDEVFHTECCLRNLLYYAFDRYSKEGKKYSSKKYGIDYYKIIEHLGPCPGDREDYHIDHILPLCAFNFNNEIHIKAAFAPENHRWLLKEENMKKKNNFNIVDFEDYIKKFIT